MQWTDDIAVVRVKKWQGRKSEERFTDRDWRAVSFSGVVSGKKMRYNA